MSDLLVWIDCEMTGLDLRRDALIEVAVVVTGADLVPLDSGLDVTIKVPDEVLDGMIDVVRDMHDKSGLTTAVQEQLGLRLESTRGPVEVVVIDRIEKPTLD